MLLPSFWQGILMKDDLGYVATPFPQSPQGRTDTSRIEQPLILHPEYWGELTPLHPIDLNIKSEKIAALRLKYQRNAMWLTTYTSDHPAPPTQPMLEPTVLPTVVLAPNPRKQNYRPSPLVRIPEMGRVDIYPYQEKSIGQLLGIG
jgi:hypothetical protein